VSLSRVKVDELVLTSVPIGQIKQIPTHIWNLLVLCFQWKPPYTNFFLSTSLSYEVSYHCAEHICNFLNKALAGCAYHLENAPLEVARLTNESFCHIRNDCDRHKRPFAFRTSSLRRAADGFFNSEDGFTLQKFPMCICMYVCIMYACVYVCIKYVSM
jgi:hypothetical protein